MSVNSIDELCASFNVLNSLKLVFFEEPIADKSCDKSSYQNNGSNTVTGAVLEKGRVTWGQGGDIQCLWQGLGPVQQWKASRRTLELLRSNKPGGMPSRSACPMCLKASIPPDVTGGRRRRRSQSLERIRPFKPVRQLSPRKFKPPADTGKWVSWWNCPSCNFTRRPKNNLVFRYLKATKALWWFLIRGPEKVNFTVSFKCQLVLAKFVILKRCHAMATEVYFNTF